MPPHGPTKIYKSVFEAGRDCPRPVVAIAKFDLLHLGHKKLIKAARREAGRSKRPCVLMTFEPDRDLIPRRAPDEPALSLPRKIEALSALGVSGMVVLPFDKHLLCASPEAFVLDILDRRLKPSAVFVCDDFCFGQGRARGETTLAQVEQLGRTLGFPVHAVGAAVVEGERVTAARIRELIREGRVSQAEKLLGRSLGA